MRSHAAIAVLSAMFFDGCQPTVQELGRNVDRGVGGYTGPVSNFTVPVVLRYEASGPVTLYLNNPWQNTKGETQRMRLRNRVTISSIGEQRLWDIEVVDMEFNDKKWTSRDVPLVSARALSTPQGPITDIDLDFPHFRRQGAQNIPDRSSDIYKSVAAAFRDTYLALPSRGVLPGDSIWTGEDFLKRLFSGMGNVTLPSPERVRSNTLAAKVVGQTWYANRQMLLIQVDGSIDIGDATGSLIASSKGHWLIDSKSGQLAGGTASTKLFIRTPRESVTAEAFYTMESSF
jgi:hypothetical protein